MAVRSEVVIGGAWDMMASMGRPPKTEQRDFTKTRIYAGIDLVVKVISAIGVIVLGLAGWAFQRSAQKHSDSHEAQLALAKRYLPTLQNLAQLQIAFSVRADSLDLSEPSRDDGARWASSYLLSSLRYPQPDKAFPKGVPDEIQITPLSYRAYELHQPPGDRVRLSFVQAAGMAAELESDAPDIRAICAERAHKDGMKFVSFASSPPALYFSQLQGVAAPGDRFLGLLPANAWAWKAWFHDEIFPVEDFCKMDLGILLRDVARGAGDISATIVNGYPALSENVVSMRADALKLADGMSEGRDARVSAQKRP